MSFVNNREVSGLVPAHLASLFEGDLNTKGTKDTKECG